VTPVLVTPIVAPPPSAPRVERSANAWFFIAVAAAPATTLGLLRGLSGDLPAAYAGIALLTAVAVAVLAKARHSPATTPTIAAGCAAAVAMGLMAPAFPGARLDVVAVVVITMTLAIALGKHGALGWIGALSFLAWPPLHTDLIGRHLAGFTSWTVWAVHQSDRAFGFATRQGRTSAFAVVHDGKTSILDVALSCSGANGLAATVIFGIAILALSPAPLPRRLMWLLVGLAAQWVANVVRIMVIFWVAKRWGVRVAIDDVHPIIGLVTFIAILVAMWRIGRRMGITPVHAKVSASKVSASTVPRLLIATVVVCAVINVIGWNTWSPAFDPTPLTEALQTI
jgi:exosortase/archaeosortase family protein